MAGSAKVSKTAELELFRKMARSRALEEASIHLWEQGLISGELHTSIGEEAVAPQPARRHCDTRTRDDDLVQLMARRSQVQILPRHKRNRRSGPAPAGREADHHFPGATGSTYTCRVPLYLDVHPGIGDATAEDVAAAHKRDLEVQDRHGVKFLTYWYNDPTGKTFCLVEAPDAASVKSCHREAHGLMPNNIIEVDGPSLGMFLGDWATDLGDRAMTPGADPQHDSGLRVIMFTDIEGSTDLSTSMGDERAMQAVRAHDSIVRGGLESTGGREVKHTGDGILASFTSVTNAIDAALDIQERTGGDSVLAIKIGMSAGEPVEESRDMYGAAVNLAARVCAHATGGQTLAAGTVRDLAIGKAIEFTDQGPIALKGFAEPIHLYEIVGRA